ncbi:gamma-glutamyl-gamma-aminobutyrate hydrolase family protein [Commensalibacter communis]|uniref:gamma-glutamyl-gamma-aminobutyrate hydrolase family protein n=1 Tax=Commensalibacter communis TaxID=2972786 RepID=UPI0022FFB7C1|nr:gamma-glutamyl-gamma-aminobutyrate hydrolase family protein [Commensalibacter communis]CAI3938591.1 Gamma-glutamyl-gamma-aminobutyrate hydrolase PuuD (putrescine degradation) [Commensalibacter communis]CAI3939660.1 Gamma-glutamyl-gamma-aminobutyrate hydrolase PuuD (putrescine degradation) [Commensalibacter communis]
MTNLSPPIIGITLDALNGSANGYSAYPWVALRKNYTTITIEAGGIPIGLPPVNHKNIDILINKIDGLIISGGNFDIHPSLYGSSDIHPSVQFNEARTAFELTLVKAAWERNIPILGICGGAQLMAVYLGGELYQHLPDDLPDALPHEQDLPPHQGSHSVIIRPNTILSTLSQRPQWAVNSSHHQGIKSTGRGIVSAVAEDNLIEAIEDPSRDFFVGVQWHPEFGIEYPDRKIFSALIAKAKLYAQHK